MSYVYIISEPGLFTVGFYDPLGKWHGDSDHSLRDEAAKRVHYLNGGVPPGTRVSASLTADDLHDITSRR